MPIDSSSPAVRLNRSRPHSHVQAYRMSHDGLGVAYLQDQDLDETYELFVAPIDGSVPPGRRTGPLPSGGDVTSFLFTPGDQYLVYHADEAANEVFELYRANVFGGGRVKLSGPLVTGGDVGFGESFQLTADGRRVVYAADQLTSGVRELFSAPLDAPGESRRESGPLPSYADVGSFAVAPIGRDLLYLADTPYDHELELFHSTRSHRPSSRRSDAPEDTVERQH